MRWKGAEMDETQEVLKIDMEGTESIIREGDVGRAPVRRVVFQTREVSIREARERPDALIITFHAKLYYGVILKAEKTFVGTLNEFLEDVKKWINKGRKRAA